MGRRTAEREVYLMPVRAWRRTALSVVAAVVPALAATTSVGASSPQVTTPARDGLAALPATVTPQDATPSVLTPLTVTGSAGCASTAAQAASVVSSIPVDHIACVWQQTPHDATHPIALSSPAPATLGGVGAVVVGDRDGDLYAFSLASGKPVWSHQVRIVTPGTGESAVPIDSTPSVGSTGELFVGAGNATSPDAPGGGYYAFSRTGAVLWHRSVADPPTDAAPATGVQASLSVATLAGTESVAAGSLDQEGYALATSTGAVNPGWPFFDSDSVFSTAAVADLYGTGAEELVEGAAQTAGFANGQLYTTGGHLRILTAQGNLVCHYDASQSINSSPAVGDFLPGGRPGIVVGTGDTFPGAPQTDALLAFDNECHLQWQTTLGGTTSSSPALADVTGTGTLEVVEGAITQRATGTVYVLDAATGKVLWSKELPGEIIGSVTTADLTGGSFQDLLVPTTAGIDIVSGTASANHPVLAVLDGPTAGTSATTESLPRTTRLGPYALGFQNSPLVTVDPNGQIGITVAGYGGPGRGAGYVTHFEVPATKGVDPIGPGTWPEFHHDPQLTGDVDSAAPDGAAATAPCQVPSAVRDGYELAGADGGIYTFGDPFCGSTATHPLNAPIVGAATAPGTGGYWLVGADGGVFAYGGAGFFGSMGGKHLNAPIVAMAATPDGQGYWLVASDGGVFAFGDASFEGSMGGNHLNAPIVGVAPTADGLGYRLVAADGGVFCFGQDTRIQFFGSMGGQPLNAAIVGIATDQATGGYWLVASDGGIFAFNAPFFGSTGALTLSAPIVGMLATQNGYGYRFVGADGGVFAFGQAGFGGSMGGQILNAPVVALVG